MPTFKPTAEQIAQYHEDGYLMVEDLFDAQEMELLLNIGRGDRVKSKLVDNPKDTSGRESKLWLTNDIDTPTIYNAICRSHRVAASMDDLMGAEMYLYHYKMMVKEPRVGGAWEWHQDYGYWYNNEALYPDMASCYIAVDRAYKGNGCLQVLKGSHKLGRIEHGTYGTQTGADPQRVALASKHMELVYCEMTPGTALFFHGNLLHRSDPNESEDPRWSLICCYNAKHNPVRATPGHSEYRKLDHWDDSQVREVGQTHWNELQAVIA